MDGDTGPQAAGDPVGDELSGDRLPLPSQGGHVGPLPPPEGLVEPTSRMGAATGGQGGLPGQELPAQLVAGLRGWWVDGGPPRPPAVTVLPSRGTGL